MIAPRLAAGLAALLIVGATAVASAQDSSTAGAVWPKLSARYQWPSKLSQTLYVEIKNEASNESQQFGAGTDLSYQVKAIKRPHLRNVDPSKEHAYVFDVGYEYLDTQDDGTPKYENRLKAQATGRHRPSASILIEDRNRFEFRWVDGDYSSRYRNRLRVEADMHHNNFRYSPYVTAEVFYSWATNSWNEQRYSIGIQWPYKQRWLLDTYYLRQNCTTCDPAHLNVGGLSLSVFFGTQR